MEVGKHPKLKTVQLAPEGYVRILACGRKITEVYQKGGIDVRSDIIKCKQCFNSTLFDKTWRVLRKRLDETEQQFCRVSHWTRLHFLSWRWTQWFGSCFFQNKLQLFAELPVSIALEPQKKRTRHGNFIVSVSCSVLSCWLNVWTVSTANGRLWRGYGASGFLGNWSDYGHELNVADWRLQGT